MIRNSAKCQLSSRMYATEIILSVWICEVFRFSNDQRMSICHDRTSCPQRLALFIHFISWIWFQQILGERNLGPRQFDRRDDDRLTSYRICPNLPALLESNVHFVNGSSICIIYPPTNRSSQVWMPHLAEAENDRRKIMPATHK